MTGSVALDVVIGLVFIYLLYSLFATVILEIINSFLGLRARNLRYTLRRMLMDEKIGFWFKPNQNDSKPIRVLKTFSNFLQKSIFKLINSFVKISGKSFNLSDTGLFNQFYERPSIKYLSSGGISNKPSYISSNNFSKTLIDTLISKFNVDDILHKIEKDYESSDSVLSQEQSKELDHDLKRTGEHIKLTDRVAELSIEKKLEEAAKLLPDDVQLKEYIQKAVAKAGKIRKTNSTLKHNEINIDDENLIERIQAGISVLPEGSDTRVHLESLLREANKDVEKFKLLLEGWFDDTMERASGWFKRSVQYFLLIIGFVLAVSFNANTLDIIKKLSNDTEAREQLVDLAIAYNSEKADISQTDKNNNDAIKSKRDSLLDAAEIIKSDIYSAQNLISSNWRISDSIDIGHKNEVKKDFKRHTYKITVVDSVKVKEGKYKTVEKEVKVSSLLHKSIDLEAFNKSVPKATKAEFNKGRININQRAYKWHYVFSRQGWNFKNIWGYLLTALAISLGSPFWFDLMNRLVKIRSSLKPKSK